MSWPVFSFPIANCRLPIGSPSKISGHRLKNRQLELGNRQCPIPAPSPPEDCPRSFAHSDATTLSSLPKSLSAKLPAPQQTDRHACSRRASWARPAAASETFVPTAYPPELATALCRQPWALLFSRPAPLRARSAER